MKFQHQATVDVVLNSVIVIKQQQDVSAEHHSTQLTKTTTKANASEQQE